MRMIWGFGGAKFSQPDNELYTKTFPNAIGTMWVEEESSSWITRSWKSVKVVHGYRVYMRIRLFNVDLGMNNANQITGLFNILSNCHESGIMVYPRYSEATGSIQGYLCHLNGNISPQDIANVPVGQWIDLEFKSINLVNHIPTASDYPDYYNLITSNGDNITTTNGNNITVRKH